VNELAKSYESHQKLYFQSFWINASSDQVEARGVLKEKLDECVQELLKAEQSGDREILYCLGEAHAYGHWVTKDKNKAISFFQMAADAGHPKSMVKLALYLERSDDPELQLLGVNWLLKAFENGESSAATWLGYAFREGRGVKTDYEQSAAWFTIAAETTGTAIAATTIGRLYYGYMGRPDKALPWLLKAAEDGYCDSFKMLARIYGDNESIHFEMDKAVYWYEQIINGKYEKSANAARLDLAKLYLSGKRQPKNQERAKDLLNQAISHSSGKSSFLTEVVKLLDKIEKGKA